MFRSWVAKAVASGVILAGTLGFQGAAHASNSTVIDCFFTVTAAGNGMQVWSPDFTMVVATLRTGQVYDLFNRTSIHNNITYWNRMGFGRLADWYPIQTTNGSTVYMAENPNSCSIDSE